MTIDNLKAEVTKADWFDPYLNPKILPFFEHDGSLVLPTKVGGSRRRVRLPRRK